MSEGTKHPSKHAERLKPSSSLETTDLISSIEAQKKLHNLQVYQLQLEMQNEELRTAHAELEILRARYFDLYDLAPVGYCSVNENNLIIESNLTATSMLGVTRFMLVMRPFFQFIYKADRDIFYLHRKKLTESGETQIFDLRMEKLDSRVFWAQLTASTALDSNRNKVCRIVINDISERKHIEESLKQSQAETVRQNKLFTALLKNLNVGVFMVEAPSGKPLMANDAALKLMGRGILPDATTENMAQVYKAYKKDSNEPYPPEQMPILKGMNGLCSHVDDMVVERPDGTKTLLEIFGSPVMDEDGKIWASLVSFMDISERKQAEALLIKSEALLASSLESQKETILLAIDHDYRYLYFNQVHADVMKLMYNKDIKIGMNILECITIDDERKAFRNDYDRALAGESHCSVVMYGESGREYYEAFFNPFMDKNNQIIGATALARNITGRKFIEESLELTAQLVDVINSPDILKKSMAKLTRSLLEWSHCEAVGIRLRDGDDYPYYETRGFPPQFIEKENALCTHDADGKIIRDAAGNPVLECMCGNILSSRFDPAQPWFTANGSFWTNSTSALLAGMDAKQILTLRNRCNTEGYESVALIPLRAEHQVHGLLQFNDRRPNRFNAGLIEHFEKLANIIAAALTQRQMKEELLACNLRHNILFMDSPFAFVILRDGLIIDCNKMTASMFGYSREQFIGQSPAHFSPEFQPDGRKSTDAALAKINEAIEKGNTNVEWALRRADGTEFTVEVFLSSLTLEQKTTVFASFNDITERKQAEQEMQKKNEELFKLNVEKDKFFSIISHDLRSPFNSFLGLTQIMVEELPNLSHEEVQKLAVGMRNSVTNLYRLLENLLHWSKMKQGLIPFVPSVIKLRPAVDESLSIMVELAREKGIEIICRIPDGLEISADSNMLQTVIRNLVSNALKFTSAGGSITVKAKITNDNGVEISVTDSGIGMNRELINNLFHIDARVARRGTAGESSTGLGLILCKEFIEKHGGTLLVESEEGKGSTFAFTIPGPKTVEPDNAIPAGKGKKIKKLKILIVDDDEASELLLRTTFKTSGSEILIAHTGVEAVAMCWKHPDIDLVLLDIEMPSMSGTEAARQIRKFNNDVIIIAQTACVVDGEINRVIAAGCNDYIAKPISQTELKKLMKKYF